MKTGAKFYFSTWGILLALTVLMLVTEYLSLPRGLLLVLLAMAMLTKASIIGLNFMHLRSEKQILIWTVALGILITGAILFTLIAVDGNYILHHSAQ